MADKTPTSQDAALRRRAIFTVVASLAGFLLIGAGALLASTGPGASGLDTELEGVVAVEVVESVDASTTGGDDAEPAMPLTADQPLDQCWPIFGRDETRASNGAQLALGIPDELVWRSGMKGLMEFPPSACDGAIYINNAKGFTVAVDAETGDEIWRRRTGDVYDTTPAIWNDRLIVGAKMGKDKAATEGGRISAVRRDNGNVLWKIELAEPVESSPIVVDDVAYVASWDGKIYAINPKTGEIKWAYATGARINGSPAVVGDRIYIANYGGRVTAITTKGKRVWETTRWLIPRVKTERFYASVAVVDDRVIAAGVGGYVYAFNAKNGNELWRHKINGNGALEYIYGTPAVSGGRILFGAYDGRVRALRSKDGKELWKVNVDGRVSGSSVVIGDVLYVSVLEGTTYGLDVATGKKLWSFPKGKYVPGIAVGDRFYFSLDGLLASFTSKPAR